MAEAVSYQDWSDFLLRIGAVCEPAEWHGMTIGFFCSCRDAAKCALWQRQVIGFMDLIDPNGEPQLEETLQSFAEINVTALAGESYDLQLLLPDDALPLNERVLALAKWCQGFLHGLALAGQELGQVLDQDAKESLQDLVNIAQVNSDGDDGDEHDFMQLVEYVRMSVFQLHTQIQGGSQGESADTVH